MISRTTKFGASTAIGEPFHKGDGAHVLVLDPLDRLAHGVLIGLVLLEGVVVHEVPEFAVVVQILQITIDDVGRLDRFTRAEGLLEHPAGLEIADLHPVERLAFAGLDEFVFDYRTRVAVEQQLQTTPELVRVVRCHSILITTQSNQSPQ